MKIRNINPEFGMNVEFESVQEMEAAIRELEQLNGGEWMPADGLKEGRDYEIVPESDGFWLTEEEAEDNFDAVICHVCGRYFDGAQGRGLQYDNGGGYVDVCPECLNGHYYLDRHNTVTNLPAGYRVEKDSFHNCLLITNETAEEE